MTNFLQFHLRMADRRLADEPTAIQLMSHLWFEYAAVQGQDDAR